jgi:hypothetical protein
MEINRAHSALRFVGCDTRKGLARWRPELHDDPDQVQTPKRDPRILEALEHLSRALDTGIQRYVFIPIALRGHKLAGLRVAEFSAAMAAFVFCGLMHEVAVYARTGHAALTATLGFTICGLIVGFTVLAANSALTRTIMQMRGIGICQHLAMFHVSIVIAWILLPALAG